MLAGVRSGRYCSNKQGCTCKYHWEWKAASEKHRKYRSLKDLIHLFEEASTADGKHWCST
jgi:hypothetical protein